MEVKGREGTLVRTRRERREGSPGGRDWSDWEERKGEGYSVLVWGTTVTPPPPRPTFLDRHIPVKIYLSVVLRVRSVVIKMLGLFQDVEVKWDVLFSFTLWNSFLRLIQKGPQVQHVSSEWSMVPRPST